MKSEEFRRIRAKLGLTQAETAAVLGFANGTVVSNIETGVRQPGRLAKSVLSLLDSLSLKEARALANKLALENKKYQ